MKEALEVNLALKLMVGSGYTYCGFATMILINEVDRLNLDSLMNWAVHRQGVEMGFQGRTNKLVDGCYTFWQLLVFYYRDTFQSMINSNKCSIWHKSKTEELKALRSNTFEQTCGA